MKKQAGAIRLIVYGIGGFFGLFVLLGIFAIGSRSDDEKSDTELTSALSPTNDRPAQQAPEPAQQAAPEPPKPKKSATELLDSVYQYDQENVDAHCKDQWEKRGELNQQMFTHCKRTEKTAYADLKFLMKKHEDFEWTGDILPRVWDQWTKRGLTQYSMVKHGMDSEIDAFLDVVYEGTQPSYNKAKLERCVEQWQHHESPFTMAKHCYEN